jgi:hypothetical protein
MIRCFMDRLRQIHELLDSCLTTEILTSIDFPIQRWFDRVRSYPSKTFRHRKVQIAVLERVGKIFENHFGQTLKGEELILVGRRVDDFLTERGYEIKSFL